MTKAKEQNQNNSAILFTDHKDITQTNNSVMTNKSISLNVAQRLNSSQEMGFQTNVDLMSITYALTTVDNLFAQCHEYDEPRIEFTGSEPLLNRQLIRHVTHYAIKNAAAKKLHPKFSITTNATLLTSNDAMFFASHHFSVTVTLDGPKSVNSANEHNAEEKSRYYNALRGIGYLRQNPPAKMATKVTVTPHSPGLLFLLQHMVSLGFVTIEFIPILVSNDPEQDYSSEEFDRFLVDMAECGRYAQSQLPPNRQFSFSDFEVALSQRFEANNKKYNADLVAMGEVDLC